MRQRALIATLIPLTLVAAACGDDTDAGPDGATPVEAGETFPDDRCEANEAAGTINYFTGFDFAVGSDFDGRLLRGFCFRFGCVRYAADQQQSHQQKHDFVVRKCHGFPDH